MKTPAFVLFSLPLLLGAADLYLAGDSTMCDREAREAPMTGWGSMLRNHVKPGVKVVNQAEGGRSSRSFLTERRWDKILNEAKPGDFVIIQFGHNDASVGAKNRYRSTSARETFKLYLKIYLAEARANGLIPILCTKTAICSFRDGKVLDANHQYDTACREVAEETGCDFIDLNAYAHDKFAAMGEAAAIKFYMTLAKDESPNYPNGRRDNCHLRDVGAKFYADAFVELARKQNLSVAGLFVYGKNQNGHDDSAQAVPIGKPWKMVLDEAALKTCKKNGDGVWNGAVVRVNGDNNARCWERVVLPVPSPAGKKIRVSAEVKAQISGGKFQIALRSADANDKTIAYEGPFVTRSQDWAPVSQVVELDRDTAIVMVYFLGLKLDDQSFAEVRNVKFEEVR